VDSLHPFLAPKRLRPLVASPVNTRPYGRRVRYADVGLSPIDAVLELLAAVGLPESCLPRFRVTGISARVSDNGQKPAGLLPELLSWPGLVTRAAGALAWALYVRRRERHDWNVRVWCLPQPITRQGSAGRVHTFCHAVPGRWHVMGVTQAAGCRCAGSR